MNPTTAGSLVRLFDQEKIPSWIEFACRTCGVPDLSNQIRVCWSRRFTQRLADASHYRMEIRLSVPLWPRMHEAEHRNTVIHETCHIIDRIVNGRTTPHGKNWVALMVRCGEKPNVTARVDRTGIARTNAQVTMHCPCGPKLVPKQRHTCAIKGMVELRCEDCRSILQTTPY